MLALILEDERTVALEFCLKEDIEMGSNTFSGNMTKV